MRRTTIMLPTKLKDSAARFARGEGQSLGGLIRSTLEQRVRQENKRKRSPLFADHFTFADNGPPDVAAKLDKYLAEIDDEDNRRERRK